MAVGATLLLIAAAAVGCFHPDKPSCAFSCVQPPHTCPSGFMCGDDGLCHDPTSARVCTIDPIDAAAHDAGDAASAADAKEAAGEAGDAPGDRGP
jgi:hypothetical protein